MNHGENSTIKLITQASNHTSCTFFTILLFTYQRTSSFKRCSRFEKMSPRSDIPKSARRRHESPSKHSGLVGHRTSTGAWLKELKLCGVSDGVTEQDCNAAIFEVFSGDSRKAQQHDSAAKQKKSNKSSRALFEATIHLEHD